LAGRQGHDTVHHKYMTTLTCATKPEAIVESKTKKLIRRVIEYVKPTHARIRYDSMLKKWAVLNKDNTPHHHFEFGVMVNVTFKIEKVKGYDPLRCSNIDELVGVAEGDLQENYYGNDGAGFHHMSFDKSNGFIDEDTGAKLTKTSTLRLMTERRALYKA